MHPGAASVLNQRLPGFEALEIGIRVRCVAVRSGNVRDDHRDAFKVELQTTGIALGRNILDEVRDDDDVAGRLFRLLQLGRRIAKAALDISPARRLDVRCIGFKAFEDAYLA